MTNRIGHRRKYKWEEWFSRAETTLFRGVDYHCSQSTMVQTIRNNASRRGISLRIYDNGTDIRISVINSEEERQALRPTLSTL